MKISIDEPCHEDWDNMQPNKEGVHCFSCQKSVIDFSTKTTNEIKTFFKSVTSDQKICGRFNTNQLKELSFDDFYEKFKNMILPHKLAIVLVFTFGFGLFSCQSLDNNGKDTKLATDQTYNVNDTDNITKPVIMGTPVIKQEEITVSAQTLGAVSYNEGKVKTTSEKTIQSAVDTPKVVSAQTLGFVTHNSDKNKITSKKDSLKNKKCDNKPTNSNSNLFLKGRISMPVKTDTLSKKTVGNIKVN